MSVMRRAAERVCLVLLLAYVVWLPLPFASVTPAAYLPLVSVPLVLFTAVALIRIGSDTPLAAAPPYRWWTAGLVVIVVIGLVQVVPLSWPLLTAVSPESARIWRGASEIAAIFEGGRAAGRAATISVNPAATWSEVIRLAAVLATFQAAALLFTTPSRRLAFAGTLAGSAMFQVLYGVREAALQRYAIWGWVNRKVFNRVTGTFVNPNHFAHYVALALPFALLLCAIAWHESGSRPMPLGRRIARLLERRMALFGVGSVLAAACIAAILLAQSRGGLLSEAAGCAAAAWLMRRSGATSPRERTAAGARRAVAAATVFAASVAALVLWLGKERTVERFKPLPGQELTLVGRTIGIRAAVDVWRHFPLFGSGLGTFADVGSMEQTREPSIFYRHAHNDYVELAATAGGIGFVAGIVALLGGYGALIRAAATEEQSFRRRAFLVAAFASLTTAMVHALFDFNSFIPANAATLAAIAGAAAAFNREQGGPNQRRSSPIAAGGSG